MKNQNVTQINITGAAMSAIRSRANGPFSETGVRRADGSWDIPFDTETLAELALIAFPGESSSETILRLCATAGGRSN